MARNKFLKRLAVTTLAATMTLGTVPAMAISAFAATAVTSTQDASWNQEQKGLFVATKTAIKALSSTPTAKNTLSSKATADDVAKAIQGKFTTTTTDTTYSVSVSDLSVTPATVTTTGYTAPVLNGTANVTETKVATTADGKTTTTTTSIEGVTFTIDCGVNTDEDIVTAAKSYLTDYYATESNKVTFSTKKDATAAAVQTKITDALASVNSSLKSDQKDDKGVIVSTPDAVSITKDPEKESRGKVAATVTLTHTTPAHSENSKDVAATSASTTFDFSGYIDYAAEQAATIADAKKVLANTTLTNQNFTTDSNGTVAVNVEKALGDALVAASISNVTVDKVELVNATAATHAADGTAKLVVTLKTGSTTDKDTYSLTIKHSNDTDTADVAVEAKKAVKSAIDKLKAEDFQAKGATKAPTEDEVKAVIEKTVNTALSDKLGGSSAILSELSEKTPYKVVISSSNYTPATTNENGSLSVKVTINGPEKADSKTTTVPSWTAEVNAANTITFPKLTVKNATSIDLGTDITSAKGQATIAPTLTPSDANTAKVKLAWKGTTKYDKAKIQVDGNDYTEGNIVAINPDSKITVKNNTQEKTIEGTLSVKLYDETGKDKIDEDSINVNISTEYTDVTDKNAYYYDPVYALANNAITNGTSASTYSPEANVKRGDFVALLYRAAFLDTSKHTIDKDTASYTKEELNKFSDVKSTDYYAKAIAWAVKNGITTGTSDTTFSPERIVTRAEAVTFIARFNNAINKPTVHSDKVVDLKNGDSYASETFTDVNSADYYAKAVSWATDLGVTKGKTATTFAPNDTVSRGQAAAFIYRYLNSSSANWLYGNWDTIN
ncbi:MAG: S-layer homology domain-containing protein [Eubacterium sp.]|nr:S-layer homology domain-containing protein [Eubacterium sp.]